jgi:hypothetical protein
MKTEYFGRKDLPSYVEGRPDKLQKLEQQIDAEFYRTKYQECESQSFTRKRMQQQAYASWSEERKAQYLRAAAEVDLSACNRLKTLRDHYYDYL